MPVSKWRSRNKSQMGSAQCRRVRGFSPVSLGGLFTPLLEDRCLLSMFPSINASSLAGSGYSLGSGQTEIIDVSTTPVLKLSGDLNNQGTIYLVSTNPLVTSVSISAQNIIDGIGARITTVLPSSGLEGYGNAIHNLSLTLIASQNIVNNGVIESASGLTALAGGSITNAPEAGASASLARLQAVGELDLLSGTVANHGVVTSTTGSIDIAVPSIYMSTAQSFAGGNLSGTLQQNINIANNLGTIQASSGSINFGGTEPGKTAVLIVSGGNLDARTINFQGGKGTVRVDVANVTGTVNVSAGSAQFASNASVLRLGNLQLDGDPTFYNLGDIVISSDISVGQSLAILAQGNITAERAVNIRAAEPLLGAGQSIYIVAGANLSLDNPTPGGSILPPGNQLPLGQKIRVLGASSTGGTISLANSTIDSRSTSTSLNQAGGNVTLIAYGGPGTGGITGVNIVSGGSGTGANGNVTLIAGGTLGSTNTAISGIAINVTGGTGPPPASIGIFAAEPNGTATFDDAGTTAELIVPGTLTARDIQLVSPPVSGGAISSDGGSIKIKTAGEFSNQIVVSSSGNGPGRDAGDITIIAGSIKLFAPLLAIGGNGANGSDALLPGLAGSDGQDGGKGGMISLEGTNGIFIYANIQADAGQGGNGGNAVGDGGAGGMGANGGMAGTISLKTTDAAVTQSAGLTISANGGNGGTGGWGANGSDATVRRVRVGRRGARFRLQLIRPANGGAGGNGGMATAGGSLGVDTGAGNINLAGSLTFNGGRGGQGGGGGNGGNARLFIAAAKAGIGGGTGTSQNGAMGGRLEFKTSSGSIDLSTISVNGGAGGSQIATSGRGGNGYRGANGGAVANAGAGAQGGQILILSTNGDVALTNSIHADGGAGGVQPNRQAAGSGGRGWLARGGNGGSIGNSGDGGFGGLFSVSTAGSVITSGSINADGGAGGEVASAGGSGGRGRGGGFGGDVGNAGKGAQGGSVSITSKEGYLIVFNSISVVAGAGGINSASGGSGGASSSGAGGRGGSVGSGFGGGGAGGKGGDISLSSGSTAGPLSPNLVPITVLGQLVASGGEGGALMATGGDGGRGGLRARGGTGGDILQSGWGGEGGSVLISGKDSINLNSVVIAGGDGGRLTGTGGQGATGSIGGDGGNLGTSGEGGAGGKLIVTTSQILPTPPKTIIVTISDVVNAGGGASGIYSGKGGNGANGLTDDGGNGGAAGSQGSAGAGGTIEITGLDLRILSTGALTANGGNNGTAPPPTGLGPYVAGYSGKSGDGGNGAGNGNGGDGGRVGDAGSAGKGGDIRLNFEGAITVYERQVDHFTLDSIAARGGLVSTNFAVSGKGGDAGPLGIVGPDESLPKGGDSDEIGKNGSGGRGGNITIVGGAGDMTGIGVIAAAGGKVYELSARTSDGGDAGQTGLGGRSGNIGNNGNGGDGGKIIISSTSGAIGLSPLIAAGGDVDGSFRPQTGDGGRGGSIFGNGGASGDIGNNGNGGDGGLIKLTSDSGDIKGINEIHQESQGVSYVAAGGTVATVIGVTTAGLTDSISINASSQARTGKGGNANNGNGGNSGKIGTNGAGGTGGEVTVITKSGEIVTPRGGIITAGGDGGTDFNRTGDGGSTRTGVAGSSGNIGRNSNGGNAGPITLESTFGNITVGGVLILRGAMASNSGSRTGNGGTAIEAGQGGNSGDIGSPSLLGGFIAGGTAGKGGKLTITAGGSILTSEIIIATGGNAGALSPVSPIGPFGLYLPMTGNGGNGSRKGGNSGSIGQAGIAGNGGEVIIKTVVPLNPPFPLDDPDMNLDRIWVNGGHAGLTADEFPGIPIPRGDGVQRGITGNGGESQSAGGNAGKVGSGISGGGGGKIEISSAGEISTSVYYQSNGGDGGSQAGIGGQGGRGKGTPSGLPGSGGNGGSVDRSGNGGNGGTITLLANKQIVLKEVSGSGGNGGYNFGKAGAGGNGLTKGGDGGELGGSGDGGQGGTLVIKTPPPVPPSIAGQTISIEGNQLMNFVGGNGGLLGGSAGNGGNGTNQPAFASAGGIGGKVYDAGSGGSGGSITLQAPGGEVSLLSAGASVNGGINGAYLAKSGNGGSSTGAKIGGIGGDSGSQGDAGGGIPFNPLVMTISIETGTFTLVAHASLLANGGDAQLYVNTPGNGGDGGGRGGNGGAGGHTGSGGLGGTVKIKTDNMLQIEGMISANGGARGLMSVSSGNGGDGGPSTGSGGGDAGAMLPSGSAGGGGAISLESAHSDVSSVDGTGILIANGGGVNNANVGQLRVMVGGKGGNAGPSGTGGDGGSTSIGPDAGGGGNISVKALTAIALPYLQANAGSVSGVFDAVGGNGGDNRPAFANRGDNRPAFANVGAVITGGNGGNVDSNGDGGIGGTVVLSSKGTIQIGTVSAIGGSVGDVAAIGGKGGNRLGGNGQGGVGGSVGNNGNGGMGGKLVMLADQEAVVSGRVDLSGGSVGGYNSVSGDGGGGSNAGELIGGAAGKIGGNGIAGDGGSVSISANAVTLIDAVFADGGSVLKPYTGRGGSGGDGKGRKIESVGGDGALSIGGNGQAGSGGSITIEANFGSIMAQLISANGGKTSAQLGISGDGGNGGKVGGAGGGVGSGTAGGAGGTVSISSAYGDITLNGDVRAIGSAGGDVIGVRGISATAGNGGNGSFKGGAGGSVGAAGGGGNGGSITIKATLGTLNIDYNQVIAADGGDGGNQSGFAGNGGDSNPAAVDTTGGKGGDIGPSGKGGVAGTINIVAVTKPANINKSNVAGTRGQQNGTPGQGGKGRTPGEPGRFLIG